MNSGTPSTRPFDLTSLRDRLAGARGKQYWRSLDEVAQTKEFREFMEREFPAGASILEGELNRRQFLKLMGASLALAGLSACMRGPAEAIVPYVKQPEEIIPGKPLFFATAMTRGGFATGLLVESNMGRPTKIEGNPSHPASLGATDAVAQASILGLYDPDRSQVIMNAGEISTWSAFLDALNAAMQPPRAKAGATLRILTETITSPTLAFQLRTLLEKFPQAQWHQYEPLARDNVRAGARLALGEDADVRYRFDRAEVIVSFDLDFLFDGPGQIRYTREFADKRRIRAGQTQMNRLYVAEPTVTTTGAMADQRIAASAGRIEGLVLALAREVGISAAEPPQADERQQKWVRAAARDLLAHRGAGIVAAGDAQPPFVHAMVHAVNHVLGNAGETVVYIEPVAARPENELESLRQLVAEMDAGAVDLLVILGGNPVYQAPADLHFADALSKVAFRARLGLYDDETSALCHWHIPEAHYLETWSDGRAFDGTVTVMQPLIAPLYDGRSAHELLAVLAGQPGRTGHDLVREYWKGHGLRDDNLWHAALNDGLVAGTASPPKSVTLRKFERPAPAAEAAETALEALFRADPTIGDGCQANNAWLQELPKPITRLTWDNAALVGAKTAEQLDLADGDVVELQFRGRMVRAPVWIVPGQADEAVVLPLGYGRTRAGRVGNGAGFNAYAIRPSDAPWFAKGLQVRKTGDRYPLSCTQHHQSMEGRDLVRVGTIGDFLKNPAFAHNEVDQPSLYPGYTYDGYKWGMSIDLTACVGCSACVVACQSENNIPVVGRDQVARGREMHWIRIDRYYQGGLDDPDIYFEPVPCMQCENAPCELVCPVGATNHTDEGLNAMVYNRCIGTRYCSNNCPYKVRRFNFLQYSDLKTESLKLMRNPDVTVRNRGVMEKCTYCVQRIQAVKINAEVHDRKIRDGEIVPACAQACPAQAIVFGDMNDPASRVARLKAEPHNYGLLVELNTRPRTTYLARIRNPGNET